MQRGVAQFGDVMRRDGGGHADRDALRAIGEQVRKGRRQHDRLARVAGVIVAEVDRVLVESIEQQARDLGHARFGVAVGGRAIAVDIAEVTLTVDQRVARGKVLRQPDERVVDRLIAVRVERTHDVADDLGGLLERRAGVESQDPHPVKDAPVHRFQPVARVRERPAHDGRQRVGEIPLLEGVAQTDNLGLGNRIGGRGGEGDLAMRAGYCSCTMATRATKLPPFPGSAATSIPCPAFLPCDARVERRMCDTARRTVCGFARFTGQDRGIGIDVRHPWRVLCRNTCPRSLSSSALG